VVVVVLVAGTGRGGGEFDDVVMMSFDGCLWFGYGLGYLGYLTGLIKRWIFWHRRAEEGSLSRGCR